MASLEIPDKIDRIYALKRSGELVLDFADPSS